MIELIGIENLGGQGIRMLHGDYLNTAQIDFLSYMFLHYVVNFESRYIIQRTCSIALFCAFNFPIDNFFLRWAHPIQYSVHYLNKKAEWS